jgi:hypothetical protein
MATCTMTIAGPHPVADSAMPPSSARRREDVDLRGSSTISSRVSASASASRPGPPSEDHEKAGGQIWGPALSLVTVHAEHALTTASAFARGTFTDPLDADPHVGGLAKRSAPVVAAMAAAGGGAGQRGGPTPSHGAQADGRGAPSECLEGQRYAEGDNARHSHPSCPGHSVRS